jgi:hypothetical protein
MSNRIVLLDSDECDDSEKSNSKNNEENLAGAITHLEMKIFLKSSLQLLEQRDSIVNSHSRYNTSAIGLLKCGASLLYML